MNMFFRSIVCLLILSFLAPLTGCDSMTPAYVKRRERAYLTSCQTPTLQVPGELSSANIGDDYIIPPLDAPGPRNPVDITPPGLYG